MPDYIYHAAPSSYMDSLYHAQRLGINKLISPSSINKIKATTANVANSARSAVAKVGGTVEREWKKHKWVARKRGKDGKWIYDYGNGYPDEQKKNVKKKQKISDAAKAELQGKNFRKERSDAGTRPPRISKKSPEEFEKARVLAQYRRYNKGLRASKYKDLDYDSDNYVIRDGQKVRKAEDGTAYVRTRNPYKRNYYGKTAREAARDANSSQQKNAHSLKTKRGRQVY